MAAIDSVTAAISMACFWAARFMCTAVVSVWRVAESTIAAVPSMVVTSSLSASMA